MKMVEIRAKFDKTTEIWIKSEEIGQNWTYIMEIRSKFNQK